MTAEHLQEGVDVLPGTILIDPEPVAEGGDQRFTRGSLAQPLPQQSAGGIQTEVLRLAGVEDDHLAFDFLPAEGFVAEAQGANLVQWAPPVATAGSPS